MYDNKSRKCTLSSVPFMAILGHKWHLRVDINRCPWQGLECLQISYNWRIVDCRRARYITFCNKFVTDFNLCAPLRSSTCSLLYGLVILKGIQMAYFTLFVVVINSISSVWSSQPHHQQHRRNQLLAKKPFLHSRLGSTSVMLCAFATTINSAFLF